MAPATFKRTIPNIIKNFLYTFFSPLAAYIFVYFIGSIFIKDSEMLQWIAIGISALIFLALLKMLLIDDKVVVTVYDDHLVYQSGKKVREFYFNECQFGYKSVSSSGTTDTIDLNVVQNGNWITLNCEPLGPTQFQALYSLIKDRGQFDEPQKLN
ncbi:hypothetical protein H9L01_07285 [Erysipelothrix inopinata]|uniref:Uncharacterized protein n=1 Tax=Erysipelothrix inopinata TaxID=225084 RepID=A0A7G9RX44_9FIRM|nr:hypothetical protein [Erysipelothrix inopinata]QNN60169.1 hypothetical protein H9L01_07285 [Erysipelothrix inopinata]